LAYFWFVFICAVWGSSFILMKYGTVYFSPVAVGAWRLISGAAVLALIWWRVRGPWALKRRDFAAVAFVVVFGFAWPFSIQPHLVARDGSAFISMIVGFTPLVTIAVSIPLLKIYPERRQILGVLGALGFLALLVLDGHNRRIPLSDLALALTVPVCYALTNTLIRRSLAQIPSLELSLVSLTAAGAMLLPFSVMAPCRQVPIELSAAGGGEAFRAIAAVAILGILGTGVATFGFNKLIQEQGPLFAGMVTNLVPIGGLLWGWADREPVTPLQLVALAGLVSMVTIVQFGGGRMANAQTPMTNGTVDS